MDTESLPANVIRFRSARSPFAARRDQRSLMDAVYMAGSLPIAADDSATKAMATRLTIFGFVVIDEIQADGSARRLRPSEAVRASTDRPWRVAKPTSRYALADGIPASDASLFKASPA
ncbi:hypothetical protein [Microvirga massiliensis]|uniref:hypothetical protein n=1 Tax=Microvirga massiliensis TaxID=1033741 RepID=UPI00062BCEFF|nr:hypothetical protein [Microvirga massiliensis]